MPENRNNQDIQYPEETRDIEFERALKSWDATPRANPAYLDVDESQTSLVVKDIENPHLEPEYLERLERSF